MVNIKCQTDSGKFFDYVLDFLRELEKKIMTSDIAGHHLLSQEEMDQFDRNYEDLEILIRNSQEKLNAL